MEITLDGQGSSPDISNMTRTFNFPGGHSVTQRILRAIFIIAATIGGFFILAASAAFAFFIAVGILILGALTFAFFWTRAKLFGRPFGPQAHFEKARAEMEAQFKRHEESRDMSEDGPIIDARRTPDGWSVDD
jgi:hypothetical protein